ncbi:hypothetical protein P153DRAFT_333085 [Dothidotthia symphoricarpi CBS 119687]|uniref:Integral membrane protein n=1 Tax=Dothidotthia symphoricarpi CBS 119687 TaxID=1392245 RepID=A0A6A6ALG4_9PLEO|nr:uncharacterized protein P153DRAFT_333085 [Dothidotthia symphoricarpi CBS 119687]KAF2132640.1 hypothetical protein P153DRAFT_333085 [Dothidotthia symphoricarpi CBS 119687]
MENRQDALQRSSTVSTTTTTQGPHTVTNTSSTSGGQGALVTTNGPHSTTVTHPTVTTTVQTPGRPLSAGSIDSSGRRSPSIRIRSPPAHHHTQHTHHAHPAPATDDEWQANRRRSVSAPQPPPPALFQDDEALRRQKTADQLRPVLEEGARTGDVNPNGPPPARGPSVKRRPLAPRQLTALNMRRKDHHSNQHNMDASMVDVLDVIDPEISALTTLNNVQNSLFLPNIPWLYNRQPTYDLGQSASDSSDEEAANSSGRREPFIEMTQQEEAERAAAGLSRTNTLDSVLSTMEEGDDHHYAVLPHGASLPGWTRADKAALDDHVRHLLHSRRARFKRTMRGFGRYCRNPLGLIVTLYFFLITFWGTAWVLFLIGWIYVAGRQAYFIEIADQVLTALFCVVGITMFPFRLVDTYHMIYVAHFAHKTWRVRRERGLGKLKNHNELPAMPRAPGVDATAAAEELERQLGIEAPVLTPEEQTKLEHHQAKLAKSHTFYRPHETYTHNAFSIRLLIAIVVLLDCHSMFQCALGGTTWGIYYKRRPKALTAIILSFSLSCNITAGILIGRGDRRSRKKLVVEQLMRQEMTEEALEVLRKERGLKAKGLKSRKQKQKAEEALVGKQKNPLDTILHRG